MGRVYEFTAAGAILSDFNCQEVRRETQRRKIDRYAGQNKNNDGGQRWEFADTNCHKYRSSRAFNWVLMSTSKK